MNEETKQKSAIKRLGRQVVGVFGWVRNQWQTNPLPTIVVVILLLLLVWITWKTGRLGNLGLGDKTYWDWMELLIIPIVLAIGAWWLNKSERENEREIADKRREDDRRIAEDTRNQATLEAYFDRMTELLLEKGLRESKEGDEVRSIARTRTLAVLRSLDRRRKGQVIQFLYEAGLIGSKPVVRLNGANLREANLVGADLPGANLGDAILIEASLIGANLSGADLNSANLFEANLSEINLGGANLGKAYLPVVNLSKAKLIKADLREACLIRANLREVSLSGANLVGAYLNRANLREANLSEANLGGTYLIEANLTNAKITDEQLVQAASLKGATLPDGTKVPDEETADEQE